MNFKTKTKTTRGKHRQHYSYFIDIIKMLATKYDTVRCGIQFASGYKTCVQISETNTIYRTRGGMPVLVYFKKSIKTNLN